MWQQKSRAKWVKDDRNTKYYHLKTITRKMKNEIHMLRNQHGSWVEDQELLKSMAKEDLNRLRRLTICRFSAIKDSWFTDMAREFIVEEVI